MGSKPMWLVSLEQEIRTHTQGKPREDTEKAAIYKPKGEALKGTKPTPTSISHF